MSATASLHYQLTGANQVVVGSKKVEQSLKDVKNAESAAAKASARRGIAILETSRAIEDFSMAGMRGALNNIPMVLTNIGAAAGVAAGATIGLVLAMEAAKAVEAALAKIHADREREAERGIKAINIMQMENDLRDDSIKKAGEYKDVIDSINSEKAFNAHVKGLDDEISSMKTEIDHIEKLISLEKERVTEKVRGEKIALATKEKSIAAAYTEARNSVKTLVAEKEHLKMLNQRKEEQQSIIDLNNTDEIKSINKRVRDAAMDATRESQRFQVMQLPEAKQYNYTSRKWENKNLTDAEKDALVPMLNPLVRDQTIRQGLDASDKLFNQLTAGKTDAIKLQIQSLQIAEEKIKMLDEEIKKQEQLVRTQKESSDAAEEKAVLQGKTIELQSQLGKLQDENQKKQGFDALQFRSTDSMMSDMGKRGLSADEVNNSLDILNVNKSMLSRLQGIERNTKRMRNAYN